MSSRRTVNPAGHGPTSWAENWSGACESDDPGVISSTTTTTATSLAPGATSGGSGTVIVRSGLTAAIVRIVCMFHAPTYGNTYGPFGITATFAAGPYSASDSATAASTVAAGSTWHRRSVAAGRPSVTTFTLQCATTFANSSSCHWSITK